MQKREKILSGVALVVAVLFVTNQFLCGEKEKNGLRTSAGGRVELVRGPEATLDELPEPAKDWKPQVTFEKWARNPFSGALALEMADSHLDTLKLDLKGIVQKGNEKIALIGDYIVKVGETTDEFQLVKIKQDRVIIRRSGRLFTLHLEQGN